MTDLFWPGDERAGPLMSGEMLLRAMVEVEDAWLAVLVSAGIAPREAAQDLAGLVRPDADVATVAAEAEGGGNPVIPLVRLLRERLSGRGAEAARWVHRGLTSQDVLDTALMLCAREAVEEVLASVRRQVAASRALAEEHRAIVEPGRTLTQYAVPTTFGLTAATWLSGILDAAEDLSRTREEVPVQVGGAAGTLSAVTELARGAGSEDPSATALALGRDLADRLGLRSAPGWHTSRRIVTRLGDALVACTDAWGHVANDVLLRTRPEVAELSEPAAGRGRSSTMPQKHNPVLSVLVRRAALAAPLLGAQLHAAAAATGDQRSDGAWHAEWAPLRTLVRNSVVAASQTAELLEGLVVHTEAMRAHVEAAQPVLLAEQEAVRSLTDAAQPRRGVREEVREEAQEQVQAESRDQVQDQRGAAGYLGAADQLIAVAIERADRYLKETP